MAKGVKRPERLIVPGLNIRLSALSMNMLDPDHSESEQRFIVLGMSDRFRLLVVSCLTSGSLGAPKVSFV